MPITESAVAAGESSASSFLPSSKNPKPVVPKPHLKEKLGPFAVLANDSNLQDEILASTDARPIAAISPTIKEGFPRRVQSPKGTDYFLNTVVGLLATYTPDGSLSVREIPEEVLSAPAEQRVQFAAVELTTDFVNQLEYTKRRSPSQTDAVAKEVDDKTDSVASVHAERVGLLQPGDVWQWLHLIAFMLLRNEAQQAGNLVGGLRGSNTNMRPIEKMALEFAKQFPSVQLIVSADLLPGTRIASVIHYRIITPDFELPFTFDALKQKSDKTLWPVMDAVTGFYLDKHNHSSTAKTMTALSAAKQNYFKNLLEIIHDKSNEHIQAAHGSKENSFDDVLMSPPPAGKLVMASFPKPIAKPSLKLQPIPKPNISLPPKGWLDSGASSVFADKPEKHEDRDQSPKKKPLADVTNYKKK